MSQVEAGLLHVLTRERGQQYRVRGDVRARLRIAAIRSSRPIASLDGSVMAAPSARSRLVDET
jgi:hypothetical protein